jgi:serine/threonine-protein kinase
MTASDFLALVKRSGLVEEQVLSLIFPAQLGGDVQDVRAISNALVNSGLITDWQATKLLAGKYKGFMLGKYKLLSHLRADTQRYLAEDTTTKARVVIRTMPINAPLSPQPGSPDQLVEHARSVRFIVESLPEEGGEPPSGN